MGNVECGMNGNNIVREYCPYCGASAEAEYDREGGFESQDAAITRAANAIRCHFGCTCQVCERLHAAAPDLLEASQAADAAFARIEAQGADGDAWHQAVEAWCMIRAAIAKAEGVQA